MKGAWILIILAGAALPAMGAEEGCHCLNHKETDQWIRNCLPGKEAAAPLCLDFATKEHRVMPLKEASLWRVVAAGQPGCTPCKYVHPTVVLPRGGQ